MEMLNRKSLVLRGLCRGRLYLLPGPDFRVEDEKKREKKMKNKPSMNKQLSIVSVLDADIEWRCLKQMFQMRECWTYTVLKWPIYKQQLIYNTFNNNRTALQLCIYTENGKTL